jgi:hypothetical protein
VRVGEPIDANAWLRMHGEEEKKAMRALTEEIDSRLKQLVAHLNEERWQQFLPELEILLPPEVADEGNPIATLRQRKRFTDAMNHFLATDRPRAESVAAAIEQHRSQLATAGLTMDSPILRLGVVRLTLRLLKETLWLLAGLVPAIAGTLHHLVPFAVTRFIVRFIKYPGRTTVAQNRLMIGLPIYGFWYAAVLWWLATRTEVWIAWLWTGLMPLCGIAALHYAWRMRTAGRAWWQELKMFVQPKQLRRLRSEQVELRRKLQRLREEFRGQNAKAV